MDISQEEKSEFDKTKIIECIRRLEGLKNEHNMTLRKLRCNLSNNQIDNAEYQQKVSIIKTSLVAVDQALFDANSIMNFYSCLEAYEVKQNRIELELKVLKSENIWQKNEIQNLLSMIQDKDKSIVELESQLQQLSFMEKFNSIDISNSSQSISRRIEYYENKDIQDPKTFDEDKRDEFGVDNEIPSKLSSLHPLIIQYVKKGKYEIALPLCKQVIDDIETTRGHYDPDIAVMLYIMALVHRDLKNYNESIKYLLDSLHIRETIYGEDDLTVASTLNNLSVLYGKITQLDNAEAACLKALHIRETVLGPLHADVGKQLTNLALIYQQSKNYIEAEDCFLRARNIFKTQLGCNDPYYIKTQSNLGILYARQEKYIETVAVFESILIQLYDNLNEEQDDAKNINADYNLPYDQMGQWHKASRVDKPTINSIFKHLSLAYIKLKQNDKLLALKSIKEVNHPSKKIIRLQNLIMLIKS